MKKTIILLTTLATLSASAKISETLPTPAAPATTPAPLTMPEECMLSGSLSTGVSTSYTGRGYLPTRKATMGDGAGFVALKLDLDTKTNWSVHGTVAYKYIMSGHTLFGGAKFGPHMGQLAGMPLPKKNIENEFVVAAELRYTFDETFSFGAGFDYAHGGLLGVMAKHFADKGASSVSEFFVKPTYTPFKWMEISVPVRYSIQGVKGWWFEPSLTFKAPLIGTAEDVKVAGLLSFNMSATGDYFQEYHGACANGSQAWWIQLSTPWFMTDDKNLILTPSVSFHWLGKGAIRGNKHSEYAKYTGDAGYVPFQNFGVVGGISLTYKF